MTKQSESADARPREDHTPEAIAARLRAGNSVSYLPDAVYGALDGGVTTFAVVSGVAGADLPAEIVLVLGIANLVADGFSMGAANFAGVRAERQQAERTRRQEHLEILEDPEGEREEIRQIFAHKGIKGDALEQVVDAITADEHRWVSVMLAEEHGVTGTPKKAWKAGSATFAAFVVCGAIPLMPYLIQWGGVSVPGVFAWSAACTALAFAAVGAFKARFVDQPAGLAAIETVGIGGSAAVLAYLIGYALRGLVAGV